jgi:hypothetical protein
MKKYLNQVKTPYRWLLLITMCLMSFGTIGAQSITWAIVAAAGFEDGNDGGLRWVMGEPLTTEVTGEAGTLRVGFLPFTYFEEDVSASTFLDPTIDITIAPNPASSDLRIQVPGSGTRFIRIISIDGVSHMGVEISNDELIDIHSLPSGPYVLYVIEPSGSFNSKTFIKS